MDHDRLNEYERRAQREVQAWRHKPPGVVARRVGAVLEPVDKLMEKYVLRGPVTKAMEAAMSVAMDAASWSIDVDKLLAEYRDDGYGVEKLDDIPRLVPMEYIDRKVSALPKYYYGSMGAEGAAAGGVSFFGPAFAAAALAADISLVTGV